MMSLIIIGEAATNIMDRYAQFTLSNPQVPWPSMRAMRNRIAHGYFDINLEVVRETVQAALPDLLKALPAGQS
ncbi:HepT-like ribonuclease domain-containing protein [Pseudomonas serbica]